MEQKLSHSMVDKKRFLRELLFRSLYAVELGSIADEQLYDMIAKDISKRTQKQIAFEEEDRINISKKLLDIFDKKIDLDVVISQFLVGWKMDRLPVVDLCILRMSVYDLFYNKDIPENVTINEAVLLAESFSDDKDKKFINGVLSSILKKLNENNNDSENIIESIKNDIKE